MKAFVAPSFVSEFTSVLHKIVSISNTQRSSNKTVDSYTSKTVTESYIETNYSLTFAMIQILATTNLFYMAIIYSRCSTDEDEALLKRKFEENKIPSSDRVKCLKKMLCCSPFILITLSSMLQQSFLMPSKLFTSSSLLNVFPAFEQSEVEKMICLSYMLSSLCLLVCGLVLDKFKAYKLIALLSK